MVESSLAEDWFAAALRNHLPQVLPEFLTHRRWFGGKARRIRAVEISDLVPLQWSPFTAYLVLVRVAYDTGRDDTYHMPLVRLPSGIPQSPSDPASFYPASINPGSINSASINSASILKFRVEGVSEDIVVVDGLADEPFLGGLLQAISQDTTFRGNRGEVRAVPTRALAALWRPAQGPLVASLMNAEQSNSSVLYGQRLVLKIFRRVEEGINPDLEIGLFLAEHTSFRNTPAIAGHLEYLSEAGTRTALGVLQQYVSNQGDAWEFTLGALAEYYERARRSGGLEASEVPRQTILALAGQSIPERAKQRIGPYLESAALLGRRTAELHMALASARENPAFTPQPLSEAEQKAFAAAAGDLVTTNFSLLRRFEMPALVEWEADKVLSLELEARQRFQRFAERRLSTMLTRIHGDYHLGQVLFTGSDFVLIDFEGEPARPLQERRRKRSPLQDVAGMLRSFHYAAYAPLLQSSGPLRDEGVQTLGRWAYYWQKWVSAVFLKAYLEVSQNAPFIPRSREELELLLDAYILDKAIYELGYELNNRPSWLRIPLEGISQLLLDPDQTRS